MSSSTHLLETLNHCLAQAMERGIGKNGLTFPISCEEFQDPSCRCFCENLEQIFGQINETYRLAEALANGQLKAEVSRSNIFAMPLKALQSSLRHLTWQTNQVAAGDLSQQVTFLGEFSESFNHMIESLRDKKSLEQRLKTITDVIGEGIYLVDTKGALLFANPEAEKLLGYGIEEMAGKIILHAIHKQVADGTLFAPEETRLLHAIANGQTYNDNDCVFTCKSGRLMPVSLACRPVVTGDSLEGAVLAFHDISEQKKYQESLHKINALLDMQASTDGLTGIYNRAKFSKLLKVEIARAARYGSAMSILMFDIDKFKDVNDTYGHQSGDKVLIEMARAIHHNIRSTEIVARWGGEEFIIIAPGCGLEQGRQLADILRLKVEQTAFSVPRKITVSFGVAVFRADDTEISLTNRADTALYRAKENGRNRVETEDSPADPV
ncbi:MAG: diguanylate [Desulfobulbaceae bacterium]|jgi:diguanylate cyclase (GGDEF)-like protein/PAS domain S-box-containing protein|nr:MAG: diguanylate [Desulfobulbaceae bacterium]